MRQVFGTALVVFALNSPAFGQPPSTAVPVGVVKADGGKRRLMVASLRYLDIFAKIDGAWLFAERLLYVDWLEQRALS